MDISWPYMVYKVYTFAKPNQLQLVQGQVMLYCRHALFTLSVQDWARTGACYFLGLA